MWPLPAGLPFHCCFPYCSSHKRNTQLPLGIQSWSTGRLCCNSPECCSSVTSNCRIWDYCCKVLKDALFKTKQAKNTKEPLSPKANNVSQGSWYGAFCHKCITTQQLCKSFPQRYQMPLARGVGYGIQIYVSWVPALKYYQEVSVPILN